MTAFGKRLLKTWLARPLYHLDSIRERQDAVAGLRVSYVSEYFLVIFYFNRIDCLFYNHVV